MYQNKNMGFLDFTAKQINSCDGNRSNPLGYLGLCNSHGTCAPTNSFSPEYRCICNAGYSINDKCLTPVGNVCDAFGQCGDMGSCDPKTGQCVCKAGAAGDQCSKCDPTAPSDIVCNGQGTCGMNGICQCQEGYQGIMCETVKRSNSSLDGSSAPSGATQIVTSVSSILVGALVISWI